MAAEAFISYFEKNNKNDESILIQDFFKSYVSTGTPVKMRMNYNGNENDLMKQARNCLIGNLIINPFVIKEDGYSQKSIESLYSLLRATVDHANEDEIAQLLFLLYCSNSNINCKHFEYFFENMSSIHLTTNEEKFLYKVDPKNLFNSLKNNKIIQNIVNKVVKDLSGKNANFDYNSCKLTFFNSNLKDLNGFAGINRIYVSISALKDIYLKSIYSNEDTFLILKMSLIRLILHEMTHVVIRHTINDFNLSSPKIHENSHQKTEADACKATKLIEAGECSEKELFNGKINWRTSAATKNLNLEYCSNFLNKLMSNQMVDFSIASSGALLYASPTIIMAVDYDFDYSPSIIFE